jgi:hypothetical protein
MTMTTGPAADRTPATGRDGRRRSFDRYLPILALTGGLALSIAGGWTWCRDSTRAEPATQLSFVPADQELGPVLVGELRKVAFRAINRDDSRPARLLGVEQHCDRQGCIFWRGGATTIPPGGEAIVEVEWKGMEPGRLVQHFPVYTDCPGQTKVRLTISGDVILGEMISPR